ncbi:MAG TPA: hypothetical protein VGF67_32535 [Ktedonobacteraceae bacterium]|jgi:hypothetical protein
MTQDREAKELDRTLPIVQANPHPTSLHLCPLNQGPQTWPMTRYPEAELVLDEERFVKHWRNALLSPAQSEEPSAATDPVTVHSEMSGLSGKPATLQRVGAELQACDHALPNLAELINLIQEEAAEDRRSARTLAAMSSRATGTMPGNGMLALLAHPQQMARPGNYPALCATASAEHSGYRSLLRRGSAEIAPGERGSRRGDLAVVSHTAANHHDVIFEQAGQLDRTRTEHHLALSRDTHYHPGRCNAFVHRLSSFRLQVASSKPVWRPDLLALGPHYLDALPVPVPRRERLESSSALRGKASVGRKSTQSRLPAGSHTVFGQMTTREIPALGVGPASHVNGKRSNATCCEQGRAASRRQRKKTCLLPLRPGSRVKACSRLMPSHPAAWRCAAIERRIIPEPEKKE